MNRVLLVGEALGVLTAQETISHDEMPSALTLGIGGAELNVAIGLSRLGVAATFVGRVGEDSLGHAIARTLEAEGVAANLRFDRSANTGLLLKEKRHPGATDIRYFRMGSAGSRLAPEDVDAIDLTSIDAVHVTGITAALSDTAHDAVVALLRRARARNVLISFDVNHRSRLWSSELAAPVYREVIALADVVFAGVEEATLAVGGSSLPEVLIDRLSALGPKEVALKRGSQGAVAALGGVRVAAESVAVDVVDTVGAGDAFAAGYLAALLEGASLAERLDLAVYAGAAACTAEGDWEGAATRDEIARLRGTTVRRAHQEIEFDPVNR